MNKNIDAAIECLNEGMKSNILNAQVYNLKLNVFSDIVQKRRNALKNYFMINYAHNQPPEQKSQHLSESASFATPQSESVATPQNDYLTVSQFTFPSELYQNLSNEHNTDRTNF